jgi:hypothetical protein
MVTGQTEFGAAVFKREPESITTRLPGGMKLPAISRFYSRRSQIQNHRSALPIEPATGAKQPVCKAGIQAPLKKRLDESTTYPNYVGPKAHPNE